MQVPPKVHELVENFDRELDTLKSGRYNEAQVRIQFVNPFFNQLGWDVENKAGFSQAYCDVIHEYSLETAEGTKAPDYCFQIGGMPKFFLETKRPTVNIKDDVAPAFQIRRYAWSAKLSLSILTDFEEFAVYDCRIKPHQKDKASVARLFYCTYKDYPSQWEEIANIFSKDAIQKGAFDRFIDSDARKKGTSEVDKAFLEDMEGWRDLLARDIARNNKDLSQKELNHLVQATLDRIVFLRICEDRKIEPYGHLQKLIANDGIYPELTKLFREADDKYNSGLFHFKQEGGRDKPDILSLKLSIGDKPLRDIIKRLYYPISPYVFSKIPTEILGQVYEKFLGKVIRLTPGHQAKVEFKPEVRKAGGVYYTPKYIVDYIVKNTVGELLKKKTPTQAKKLTILDPACGSGSFLLGAYQYLLDWYLEQYTKEPSKHKNQLYKNGIGEWVLASQEKKQILLSNIYGVDIDRQAVEVSKLSLLLKVLEGESNETIQSQLRLFRERALPDLSDNIKCGNSLIGTDFFHGKNLDMFARDDMEAINAFDWDSKDGFAEIMKSGGFDAVIGNPPYGAEFSIDKKQYLMQKYDYVHVRTPDSFNYFIALAMSLSRDQANAGFIIPNNFLFQHEYWKARKYFLENRFFNKVLNLGDNVFDVTVPVCIAIFSKSNKQYFQANDCRKIERIKLNKYLFQCEYGTINIDNVLRYPDCAILLNLSYFDLMAKVLGSKNNINLGEMCQNVSSGISTGGDKIFRIEKKIAIQNKLEKSILKGCLVGREMNAYYTPQKTNHFIIYSTKDISKKTHPQTLKYLNPFQEKLSKRIEIVQGLMSWWRLNRPRNPKLFETPKILLRQTSSTLQASFDRKGYYCLDSIIIIQLIEKKINTYIIGLLNSKLVRFIYENIVQENNRTFAQVKPINVRKIPIPKLDLSKPKQKSQHDRMVERVDQMLDTQKKLYASKSEQDRKHYQQKADILDKQIDTLVYELYELTAEEIKVVEGAG